MNDLVLAKIDRAKHFLAEAKTLQQVKEVIALSDAARIYGKRIRASIETTNYASEVRLRAERRLGQMLAASPKAKGAIGNPGPGRGKRGTKTEPRFGTPTLADIGLSKKESARAQDLAAMPEPVFEAALVAAPSKEINHNRVAKEAKDQRQRKARTAKRVAAAVGSKGYDRIIVGDFREHAHKIPDGSLSLIFTDPPYDREAEELFPALADFAAAKLADGGSILFYCGHLQLPTAFAAFAGKLRHWWTCACVHSGGKTLMREYGIRVGWKPILWFVKNTRDNKSDIVLDTVTSGTEKDNHEWQQGRVEAGYWIEMLCARDGTVCDPFLGSGTTAIGAMDIGRKWIGFELDSATAGAAARRIHDSKI